MRKLTRGKGGMDLEEHDNIIAQRPMIRRRRRRRHRSFSPPPLPKTSGIDNFLLVDFRPQEIFSRTDIKSDYLPAPPPTPTPTTESAAEEINSNNSPTPTATSTDSATEEINYSANPHTATTEIRLVNQPTGTESSQDHSKHIFMIAQPLALAALPVTLLGLAPPRDSIKPKLIVPYNAFFVLALLSIVTSIGVTLYSIIKSTRSRDFARQYKSLMIIATVSLLLATVLWSFLKLPMYVGLCLIAIGIGITLSLWYSWRKANNSSQTRESSQVLRPQV